MAVTPQQSAALKKANEIRARRKQLKQDLRARRAAMTTVLSDPPAWLLTADVVEILLAIPKVGHATIDKLLAKCMISPRATIGGLTPRQRDALIRALRHRDHQSAAGLRG